MNNISEWWNTKVLEMHCVAQGFEEVLAMTTYGPVEIVTA